MCLFYKMKRVLIISNPQDEHTKYVVEKIRDLGAEPCLFYPENLGKGFSVTLADSAITQEFICTFVAEERKMNFADFYSVWFRRPRLVAHENGKPNSEGIEFIRDEWRSLLEAIYALMKNSLWVSHPDKLREAARKPVQFFIAHELGLNTPPTLITNNAGEAKEFFRACSGKIICKPTGSGWIYSSDGKSVRYVLTNRVLESHFEADEEISTAPVTFQEEISKAYEVRANVIGQEILAVKIDSQRSELSKLDWRRYDVRNTPYSAYQLPKEIEEKCLKLAYRLGLEFGAIDLIRQPDGEYIFLEINGNGQFLWAEDLSGVKVSESLARLLAGITHPLKSASFT